MDEPARLQHWERRTEWPLTAAALLFLAAYALPILQPDLSPDLREACVAVSLLTWLFFVVDYLVRLGLSRPRRAFLRSHLWDLATVALPIFRPLRLLRLVTVLSVLNRRAGGSLRGRVATYIVGSTALLIVVASLAILDTERDAPGANITGFDDALWWAATTMTTVGYGDQYPVTGTGRVIAAALMVAGIALLSAVTATFASWLLERVAEIEEESDAATRRDLDELTREIVALREQLAGDQAPTAPDPERGPP